MKKLLLLFTVLALIACKEGNRKNTSSNSKVEIVQQPPKVPKYKIIDEKISENAQSSKIIEYVVLNDNNTISKDVIKNVLLDVLVNNIGRDEFIYHNAPTVIAVYLFTSEKIAKNKSAWIGMAVKNPSSAFPSIRYNERKIKSIQGLSDGVKSEDEIALEKLQKYLKERGLELCSFNKKLESIELKSIHKADVKYPNFGKKHMDYYSMLIKKAYSKLKKKYDLDKSTLIKVMVFSSGYCN